MKKFIFTLLFLRIFLSYSQEKDELQNQLFHIDKTISNKLKEGKIRDNIDFSILKNRQINIDSLNLSYGVFVDKLGKLFITYNDINDEIAAETLETIFNKNYYTHPFKDSITSKVITYNFKDYNRYLKNDSHYKKYYLKKPLCPNIISIETVPRYRGCKKEDNIEMRKCMAKKITKLINKNFNVNLASKLNLSPGVKRIFIRFKIDKKGKVTDIKVRAPHPKLEKEAIRVIKLIPKMKPGNQNGKTVNVRYSLPIVFRITP